MKNHTIDAAPLLFTRSFWVLPAVSFCLLIPLHFLLRELRYQHQFIMHQYWPFSIFLPKLPQLIDITTLLAITALGISLWQNWRHKGSFAVKLFIVWCIVVATNLLQGIDEGFVKPISGISNDDYGYWQDAAVIQDPADFLRHYVLLQPTLGYHSRVHPPLTVFIFYWLRSVFQQPWLAALVLSFASLAGPYFLYRWLRMRLPQETAELAAILFAIAPAFQIYALAAVDGVVAAFFMGTLYYADMAFTTPRSKMLQLTAAAFLTFSAMITFGAAWLIPVLTIMSLTLKKSWNPVIKLVGIAAIYLTVFYSLTGYSYIDGFLVAKNFEATHNFFTSWLSLFSYIVTRIQDILEPMLFMGPWISMLLILIWRQLWTIFKTRKTTNFFSWLHSLHQAYPSYYYVIIGLAGLLAFLGFISTGAYYTGETARAALYVIPPLFASLAPILELKSNNYTFLKRMFVLILGQSVLMQLFGWYMW